MIQEDLADDAFLPRGDVEDHLVGFVLQIAISQVEGVVPGSR